MWSSSRSWRAYLGHLGRATSSRGNRPRATVGCQPKSRAWTVSSSPGYSFRGCASTARLIEPLEERCLLTASIAFQATAFGQDATSKELVVYYSTDEAIEESFVINANRADTGTVLFSTTVVATSQNPLAAGSYSVEFDSSTVVNSFPLVNFELEVNLDANSDVMANPETATFTGIFKAPSGSIQVFTDPDDNTTLTASDSGSSVSLTYVVNSVTLHSYSGPGGVIHVRLPDGTNTVNGSSLEDYGLVVFGGDGSDTVSGGEDDDTVYGGSGSISVDGGEGSDTFHGGSGSANVDGGDDDDYLYGGSGINYLSGGDDEDWIEGGIGANTLSGGAGYDTIQAGSGTNDITAGEYVYWDESDGNITSLSNSGTLFVNLSATSTLSSTNTTLTVDTKTLTYSSLQSLYVTVPEGNDALTLHMAGYGATTMTVSFAGASGTDTLTVDSSAGNDSMSLTPSAVTVNSKAIAYYGLEKAILDGLAGDDTISITSTGTGSLPAVEAKSDSILDVLSITSASGGSVAGSYVHATKDTTFTVDASSSQVVALDFKRFAVNSKTVTLSYFALDLYYDITATDSSHEGDITLGGTLNWLGAQPPASDPKLLINNIANATLHGGFTTGNLANPITLNSVQYNVQYDNDVVLASHEYSGEVQVTTTAVKTEHDNVPRFGADPDVKSIGNGNWSNPNTWSTGQVPAAGDIVKISADTVVTYDLDSTTEIEAIEVAGTLTFLTDEDTQLVVGTIVVLPIGTLEIGTSQAPVEAGVSARLTFADQALDVGGIDPNQFGTGLLGFGTVSISGTPIATTWTRLAEEPRADDDELVFDPSADLDDWQEDDQLVLPDTRQVLTGWDWKWKLNPTPNNNGTPNDPTDDDYDANREFSQTEVVTIDYIEDVYDGQTLIKKIVHLKIPQGQDHAILHDHLGAYHTDMTSGGRGALATYEDASQNQVDLLPHVALLQRNVVISSTVDAETRGHVLFGGRAEVAVQYSLFKDLGRTKSFEVDTVNTTGTKFNPTPLDPVTNHVGRYSVHIHHLLGPANPTPGNLEDDDELTQYVFKGNTIQGSLKWALAIHDSHFGLVEDNVIYGAQGAGIVTEEGNEIGNRILDNIVIGMHGTYSDPTSGLQLAQPDFANAGVGLWFRRLGNIVSGNVVADAVSAPVVITSYYLFGEVHLPDFPGATHDDTTLTLRNPGGVFDDNEFYGPSEFGMWTAYTVGKNLVIDPDESTYTNFDNLRFWNTGFRAVAYVYHTDHVTFDNLLILGDPLALTRGDWGIVGVTNAKYESWNTSIINSHIEGMRIALVATPADASQRGQAPQPTLVENSTLKNNINVLVVPHVDSRPASGNFLELNSVDFAMTPFGPNVPANPTQTRRNILMSIGGSGDPRVLTSYSVVNVTDYDLTGVDFQVYYREQAANYVWPASMVTDPDDWYSYANESQIGVPAAGITNAQSWATYGVAVGGLIAPSGVDDTTYPEIDGLVGLASQGEVTDLTVVPAGTIAGVTVPSGTKAMSVLVTPWDGAEFPDNGIRLRIRYNVIGELPQGAKVWFELDGDSNKRFTALSLSQPGSLPIDAQFMSTGQHTLRTWIGDANGNDVTDTIGYADGMEVTFNNYPTASITNSPTSNEGHAGTTNRVFTVALNRQSNQTVNVLFATADLTAETSDNDYVAASGTLTFSPGQTQLLVTVQVNGDTDYEADETFKVVLSSGSHVVLHATNFERIGTIVNDDEDADGDGESVPLSMLAGGEDSPPRDSRDAMFSAIAGRLATAHHRMSGLPIADGESPRLCEAQHYEQSPSLLANSLAAGSRQIEFALERCLSEFEDEVDEIGEDLLSSLALTRRARLYR